MRNGPASRISRGSLLAVALVPALAGAAVAAPSHAWTRQFGTPENDCLSGVAVDPSGHVIVAGYTSDTVTGRDALVRKYGPNGAIDWTRRFGGQYHDEIMDVAVDAAGNIVVVGSTSGQLAGQVSKGKTDAFVRKYRPDGRRAWTRQFGSADEDDARAVAVDRAGNIVVVGETHGSITGAPPQGDADVFVRKYRPSGSHAWTRQYGSYDGDWPSAVAVTGSGAIVIAGATWGSLTGLPLKGWSAAFVRKHRPNGSHVWTRQFGSKDSTWVMALALDAGNSIYAVGGTSGTITGVPTQSGTDAFVRKHRSDGRHVWTRQFGTPGDDTFRGAWADPAGRLYVAGQTGMSPYDAFVRKVAASGRSVWLRRFGGPASGEMAEDVAVDRRGNVYVVGCTDGTLPGQTARGLRDAFIRKYRS